MLEERLFVSHTRRHRNVGQALGRKSLKECASWPRQVRHAAAARTKRLGPAPARHRVAAAQARAEGTRPAAARAERLGSGSRTGAKAQFIAPTFRHTE